jgi:hypothetical protein
MKHTSNGKMADRAVTTGKQIMLCKILIKKLTELFL